MNQRRLRARKSARKIENSLRSKLTSGLEAAMKETKLHSRASSSLSHIEIEQT